MFVGQYCPTFDFFTKWVNSIPYNCGIFFHDLNLFGLEFGDHRQKKTPGNADVACARDQK